MLSISLLIQVPTRELNLRTRTRQPVKPVLSSVLPMCARSCLRPTLAGPSPACDDVN